LGTHRGSRRRGESASLPYEAWIEAWIEAWVAANLFQGGFRLLITGRMDSSMMTAFH
jgi:hypothetical protein